MKKTKSSVYANMAANVKKSAVEASQYGPSAINLPEGKTFFSMKKKGTYQIDVIPYITQESVHPVVNKGEAFSKRPYMVHRGVGPEEATVLCLKSIKKACPICEAIAKMAKDPAADPDAIKSLKAKTRELYNIYDLADPDKGVQVLDASYFNFGAAIDKEIKEGDDAYNNFASPDEGFTLKIRMAEKTFPGGGKPFLQADRVDFIERDEPLSEELLEQAVDLGLCLKAMSYDALRALYLGESIEDVAPVDEEEDVPYSKDDDEEEEKPKAKHKRPAKDDDDDDEEEEKPKGKAKHSAKDEEEEEEAPVKKPAKKQSKSSDDDCPAGGEFGVDTDEHKECDSCDVYTSCLKLFRENKKKGKK